MIKNKTLDEDYKITSLDELSRLIHESYPSSMEWDRELVITSKQRTQFEKILKREYLNTYFGDSKDRTHLFASIVLKTK